mmetsp:Transcript_27006/g.68060  ORF Transcript_27006/g.68060 Transcript_27006/m.68060 type:complete len:229 (+) Transcript_27006:1014-1700(+)
MFFAAFFAKPGLKPRTVSALSIWPGSRMNAISCVCSSASVKQVSYSLSTAGLVAAAFRAATNIRSVPAVSTPPNPIPSSFSQSFRAMMPVLLSLSACTHFRASRSASPFAKPPFTSTISISVLSCSSASVKSFFSSASLLFPLPFPAAALPSRMSASSASSSSLPPTVMPRAEKFCAVESRGAGVVAEPPAFFVLLAAVKPVETFANSLAPISLPVLGSMASPMSVLM